MREVNGYSKSSQNGNDGGNVNGSYLVWRDDAVAALLFGEIKPKASQRCFANWNVVRISRDRSMSCFDLSGSVACNRR